MSIDIGPALMAKIIKENSQVLHRSTYQALAQEECEWDKCKAEHSLFMELPQKKLGPHAMVRDLVEVGVEDALQYDPHEKHCRISKNSLVWMMNKR